MIWQFIKEAPSDALRYGGDIDVVKYINGKRHTVNPSQSIEYDLISDFFNEQKCSMRLLAPQLFSPSLAKLMCLGDELFCCDTGVNAYITPAPSIQENSDDVKQEQGFAPHYDDIDAFLIQTEGEKKWNLCIPKDKDLLALTPSSDFKMEEVQKFKVWEGTLKKGDLLYMPRGIIHYGTTKVGQSTHSTHVTISNQQNNSWADLLERTVNKALKIETRDNIEFRENLPHDLFDQKNIEEVKKRHLKLLGKIVEKASENLKQFGIEKLQTRFMMKRQAPQEITQGNDIEESEEEPPKTIDRD